MQVDQFQRICLRRGVGYYRVKSHQVQVRPDAAAALLPLRPCYEFFLPPPPLKFLNFYFTSVVPTALMLQTGQSQEFGGACKPTRIKEVHSKLHSFQVSLCTLTATHLTLIYVCTYIRLSVPLGCLIKQAGIIIHTILNMWEAPGIKPVKSGLTSV